MEQITAGRLTHLQAYRNAGKLAWTSDTVSSYQVVGPRSPYKHIARVAGRRHSFRSKSLLAYCPEHMFYKCTTCF